MEILEYISALRALPCLPARNHPAPSVLLHAQEIFMTIDFCMRRLIAQKCNLYFIIIIFFHYGNTLAI